MERKRGIEALTSLDFIDVIVPYDQALNALTQRTRKAMVANVEQFAKGLEEAKEDAGFIERLKGLSQNVDNELPPGGFSISGTELSKLYETMKGETYKSVVDYYTSVGFQHIFSQRPYFRNPGVTSMGYLLDFANIVREDVATYPERVVTISSSLKDSGIKTFWIGAMIDDAYHLRGVKEMPFELLMDKKEVEKFTGEYIKTLSPDELKKFKDGYLITLNEMQINTTGYSAN